MSDYRKYTANDIDLKDGRMASIGIAVGLGIALAPPKTGDLDHDTKTMIASLLTMFSAMNLAIIDLDKANADVNA